MYKKKLLTSIILSIVLLMSICIPAMANNAVNTNHLAKATSTQNTNQQAGKFIINNASNKNSKDNITPNDVGAMSYFVIRNGNTTDCQVYINWTASAPVDAWRLKQLTVDNGSLLWPTVYGTIGNGSTYTDFFPNIASTTGSLYLGDVLVPTDVSEVRITVSDLQVYTLTDNPSWNSVATWPVTITIN